MAVQNYLTNFVQGIFNAVKAISGVRIHYMQNTIAKAAADNDTSTYLVFKNIPGTFKIKNLYVENDALAGGTSWSLQLYDSDLGTAKGSSLSGVMDFSAAHKKGIHTTAANVALDGIASLTHAQTLQCLYEIAGDTLSANGMKNKYDLVLVGTTVGGAAGSITVRGEFIPAG